LRGATTFGAVGLAIAIDPDASGLGATQAKEALMKFGIERRFSGSSLCCPATAMMLVALSAVTLSSATARAEDASRILKTMYDYVAGQKNISMTYDTSVEVVTPAIEKLQFTSSGRVLLSRPDKIRATRTGGYADVELVFDGKVATIAGKNINAFAQQNVSGSIDDLVGKLRDDGMDLAGADLFSARGYQDMMGDVIESKHIGRGVVNGVECEHLAFRGEDVDWQLWVEVGPRPIPRKYVITSKSVGGSPQYTILVKDWKTDPQVASDAFAFKPAVDMKMTELSALNDVDEIPHGAAIARTPGQRGESR
jgi:hypothetical protein